MARKFRRSRVGNSVEEGKQISPLQIFPFGDCLMLLVVSTVPLLVLEARKVFRAR